MSSELGFVYGRSESLRRLNAVVDEIARIQIPVLLVGESGTGKEVYARLIHRLSPLNHMAFQKLGCGALEPSRLLGQLQVYMQSNGNGGQNGPGTLFLDGIDELDLTCQKILLSLLPDEGTGEKERSGLRLISSASRELGREVSSGRFRSELYFRINGVCLRLPPLRKRIEDVPALMECLLAKHSSELKRKSPQVSEEIMDFLVRHDWPGNIRELENLARKMVALGDPTTAVEELGAASPKAVHEDKSSLSLKVAARAASRQAERELILRVLDRTHWNRKRAAQELQISYKSLLHKIKLTGVEDGKSGDR
jgi:two-component system response regulator AtoC